MAGQISTSTTRRGVLSELNVNSPLGTASLSAKRQQTIGAESQARSLGEISLHEGVKGREMSETLRQQTGLGATKRNIEAVRGLQVAPGHKSFPHIEEEAQDFKRLKTGRDSESLLKSNRVVRHERHLGSKGDGGRNVSNSPIVSSLSPNSDAPLITLEQSPLRNELDSGPLLLSASASPASSSASSSQEARDDTQITEPERDESRVIPILTQAELREVRSLSIPTTHSKPAIEILSPNHFLPPPSPIAHSKPTIGILYLLTHPFESSDVFYRLRGGVENGNFEFSSNLSD